MRNYIVALLGLSLVYLSSCNTDPAELVGLGGEPRIILGSNSSDQYRGRVVTIQYTIDAPGGALQVSFNGRPVPVGATGNINFFTLRDTVALTRDLPLGAISIPIEVQDIAFRSASATYTINVVLAPEPSILFSNQGRLVKRGDEVLVSFSVQSPGGLLDIRRINKSDTLFLSTEANSQFNVGDTQLAAGLHTIVVPSDIPDGIYEVPFTVYDLEGQETTSSYLVNVQPAAVPTIVLSQNYEEKKRGEVVLMQFTANAEAGIQSVTMNDTLSFNDFEIGQVEYSGIYNEFTVPDDAVVGETLNFIFEIVDAQSRVAQDTFRLKVLPYEPPTVTLATSGREGKRGDELLISFSANAPEGLVNVEIRDANGELLDNLINGEDFDNPASIQYFYTVPEDAVGNVALSFIAFDSVGQQTLEPAVFTIFNVHNAPTIAFNNTNSSSISAGGAVGIALDISRDELADFGELRVSVGGNVVDTQDLSAEEASNFTFNYVYVTTEPSGSVVPVDFQVVDIYGLTSEVITYTITIQ